MLIPLTLSDIYLHNLGSDSEVSHFENRYVKRLETRIFNYNCISKVDRIRAVAQEKLSVWLNC